MAGEDRHLIDNVERVRLEKALRESVILRELADISNSSLDLEHILEKLVKRTTELCEVSRCAIWLQEESWSGSRFRPVTYHIADQQIAHEVLKAGDAMWYRSPIAGDNPIIQRLLEAEGMLVIDDLYAEAGREVLAEKFQVRSVLLLALVRGGRPVGIMSLDNPGQVYAFSQDQQQLARAIAQQATIAIDNTRLYQQAQIQQHRTNQLIERARAIYYVAMTVNSGEELSTVLKLATGYLVHSLEASDSLTMLLEPNETRLRPVTPDHQRLLAPSLELKHLPNFQQAVLAGKPALVTVEEAREEELSWFRLLNLKSLLIVPLMVGAPHQGANWDLPGEPRDVLLDEDEEVLLPDAYCVGLIAIYYLKYRKPTSGEYAFAQDIAAQCALAVEKAHLLAETHRAAELANERANTLEAVFQAMTEGISVIKPDGQVEIRNNAAADLLEIPAYSSISLETFLQQNPIFTLDGLPYTYKNFPLKEALVGAVQVRGERVVAERTDGTRRVLEITATPLRDSYQQPIGLVTAFRDITTQVQAEQRVRQALDAFLYIAEAVSRSTDIREILHITLAKTLTTLHCQRGTVHLLPQGERTFNLALSRGFSPDDEARWLKEQETWLSQENGQTYGFYDQIMSGQATLISGTSCPVQPNPFDGTVVLAAPIKHDQQILGLILLDRSHLIAPSQQPTPNFTNWDMTIVEGIAQLAGMAIEQSHWQQEAIRAKAREDAMREADAMKNEFLAMTAHEFRNPLAIILMRSQSTQRALRRADGETPGISATPIEDHLDVIISQTRQLNNIVTTFLDAARINQGQFTLKYETVDLAKIVHQVVEDHTYLVGNHELNYVLREECAPYLVSGDHTRLSQIIANLVENAIKYSPLGGPVTVTLSRNSDDQGQKLIKVCVEDKGIGIPSDAQTRLFERFYRVPNSAGDQTHGIGLGLYIVAQLVHMHKGEIYVESKGVPGEGSRFIITFPAFLHE